MRNYKLFVMAIGVFFMFAGSSFAQSEKKVKLPDLGVQSVIFDPEPREGNAIGTVKIIIYNHGTADAPESELKFECLAVDCDVVEDCLRIREALKGTLAVPSISKDEEVELKWAPSVPIGWVKGNFIIAAIIDPENKVQESDELNNAGQAVVYLKQFTPETK